MTDPKETVAFLQGGQEYDYLGDVNERDPYWIIRSDGSMVRAPGIGGSAMAARFESAAGTLKDMLGGNLSSMGNFASDSKSGSENGRPLSSKSIAAVKDYLNRTYQLANIPDHAVMGWLERVTRIDDATASHEDFYERLIQDVATNEGGGDPAASEAALKAVMGEENFNQMAANMSGGSGIAELMGTAANPSELHALDMEDGTVDGKSGTGGAGGNYTIQAGDTLSAIAARYGTTVEALAAANGISDPNFISAGATLNIPGAGSDAAGSIQAGEGTAGAGAGLGPGSGGGIGGDVPVPSPDGSGSGAGAGGSSVPQQAGTGPGGAQVTPDLLKRFVDSDWHLAMNAWINRFRDAGAASIFLDFLYNNAQRFFAEWEGGIAEQALQGKLPSGSFSEFLSKQSGGLIDPLVATQDSPLWTQQQVAAASAPQTGGQPQAQGAVGPTPDPSQSAAPLPPDTSPVSPSLGQTPGLTPLSPQLQAMVLGQYTQQA